MNLRNLVYVSLFATIMAVLGILPPIPLGFTPVPITLQTLGVMLAGSILGARLGPKYAALSQILFLLLVAAGLPLLSGGRGGLTQFFGSSGGYLIGWIAGAYVTGLILHRMEQPTLIKMFFVNIVGGIFAIYLFGIPVQAIYMDVSIKQTIILSLVYLPGDFIKVVVASLLAIKLQSSIPLTKGVRV